jgi:hypothetical protein
MKHYLLLKQMVNIVTTGLCVVNAVSVLHCGYIVLKCPTLAVEKYNP